MSLRDGSKKMSKSDPSDYSRINLTDDADSIAQKIRKAKTDPEPLPSEEKGLEARPEADNLVGIYAALSGRSKADVLREFGGGQFSSFKSTLVDLSVEKLGPIGAEMKKLTADSAFVDSVLTDGADRARVIAAQTMSSVKDILGFIRKNNSSCSAIPAVNGNPRVPVACRRPACRGSMPPVCKNRFISGAGMSTKRRAYESGHKPKCLVLVDDTPECERAVYLRQPLGGARWRQRLDAACDRNQ